METLTNQRAPSDPPVASRPGWVILNRYVEHGDSSVADAKTTAASCTSSGQSFSVSFCLAAPPATSSYYCDWIGGAPGDGKHSNDNDLQRLRIPGIGRVRDESKNLRIIAAHDDTVLIHLMIPDDGRRGFRNAATFDYFLYEAGAARPPWLSLLPGCYISRVPTLRRSLDMKNTGVLRRREGELLVAQLEVIYDNKGPHDTAELCVLRPGHEWVVKKLPIVHHEGGKLPRRPEIDAALAIGSRFMCWVDYINGFFMCDMAEEETPNLRYVPLPVPPPEEHRGSSDRPHLEYCRNVAAAGPDAVRFVSVAPRCCCGGPGKTSCERSRFDFNVTTWTLTLRTEGPMTWVKDGVLECNEIWQLPNYGGLPRVAPQYPIVSSDDPDIVCFMVCENQYFDDADETEWMLQIDTRSKELLSVVREYPNLNVDTRLPAKFHW